MPQQERVVERVVYIKTDEQMNKAREESRKTTEAIISMLNRGMKPKDVASNLGVPHTLVVGLANVLGFRAVGKRDGSRYFEWQEIPDWRKKSPALTIPLSPFGISANIEWRIGNLDKDKKVMTIEWKD